MVGLTVLLLLACDRTGTATGTGTGSGAPGDAAPRGEPPTSSAPLRVVSLSPLATRFVIAIGAGARLVGVGESTPEPGDLAHLPRVDAETAGNLLPDVVIVPEGEEEAGIVVFQPHDLEDVFELCRSLGADLVGRTAAHAYEVALSRPLALLADRSSPFDRPRVAAVVGFAPLTLAGGHSFETDLIEIGGGSSTSHGGEDNRIETTREALAALAPDLVVVVTERELAPGEREAARRALPDAIPVDFFAYSRDDFWLDASLETATRMHELIQRWWPPASRSPAPVVDRG